MKRETERLRENRERTEREHRENRERTEREHRENRERTERERRKEGKQSPFKVYILQLGLRPAFLWQVRMYCRS